MKSLNKLNKIAVAAMIALLPLLPACDEYEIFDKEQYKTVIAIVSDDGYNIFDAVHDLDEDESTGYVSASCGGTLPTSADISITMGEDLEAFKQYNEANFGENRSKYAQLVPAANYSIDSYDFIIPKGGRSGKMPIRIRPEGLSPDSAYFIPLRVESFSQFEANAAKSNVLYRVFIKNRWATTLTDTYYQTVCYENNSMKLSSKIMFPLTKNSVRIMPGVESFQEDTATINAKSLTLTVDENDSVWIAPYKAGRIDVERIAGDANFPNTFSLESDGYATYNIFRLHYKYAGGATEIMEELRIEAKKQ